MWFHESAQWLGLKRGYTRQRRTTHMNTILEMINSGKTLHIMPYFYGDMNTNARDQLLTPRGRRMLEEISRKLKKPTAVFYADTDKCTHAMDVLRAEREEEVVWSGFLQTTRHDLGNYFRTKTPSYRESNEDRQGAAENIIKSIAEDYSEKTLKEIDFLLQGIPPELKVANYFVIVENPLHAAALGIRLADALNKRTWRNDFYNHPFRDGEVIKIEAKDAFTVNAPRISA